MDNVVWIILLSRMSHWSIPRLCAEVIQTFKLYTEKGSTIMCYKYPIRSSRTMLLMTELSLHLRRQSRSWWKKLRWRFARRREDPQKAESKYEADEKPTPIPSSTADASLSKRSCCTLRGEVMWELNGLMGLDACEELVRGRRESELVQNKISDFALLDMMD